MGSRVTSMVTWLLAVPGKAKTFMWQDFKAYRGGLLVVIARSISELKYLVGFAVATVSLANHTRAAADEAHCRMDAANVTAAPSVSTVKKVLKVGIKTLLSGADVGLSPNVSFSSSYCQAEKEARLTYGWDLNDWEADVPCLALISLVIATLFAAFFWTLRQATNDTQYTKEKHIVWTEGDAAFCFALNREYNSPVVLRARKVAVYLTCFGLGLLSVVAFARGTLVQLVQGRFFELYALIHTIQGLFDSNEKFANVKWEALKPRVAGHFEWPDLLMSAPSVLQEKFVKRAMEDELQEINKDSKALAAPRDDKINDESSANSSLDEGSEKEQKHLL